MGVHLTNFEGSVTDAVRNSIAKVIPDAQIEVSGGGGHYTIVVI
jgi:acid stress-induced BolA-like protein IbaG/YrbA